MEKTEIIKRFGEKVELVKGFAKFLMTQEDAILDVAVNDKLGVGAFILDRHWWTQRSGGIGMAVILGIFQNGKVQTKDSITYRDQYNPRKDKWENFYNKIVEIGSSEEVRVYELKKEPSTIWLAVKSQTKKETFFFTNKKALVCDKCSGKIVGLTHDLIYWPPKSYLFLCEACTREIKKEFGKKKYSETELHWGLGGSFKLPTDEAIKNQITYLRKLVQKLKKEVIK